MIGGPRAQLQMLQKAQKAHRFVRKPSGDADTGLPDNDIWFVLVDVNAATCCSTGDKAVTQDPSTEENEENKVATQDPYMTIPRKKRKKKKRSLTKKEKEKKSEKEKEKKAERSTVKMYYWNVALSEHCEDVPLQYTWPVKGHKVQFEVDLAKLEVRNMKTNKGYPLQCSGPL